MAAGFYGPGHNREGWRPDFMARAIIATDGGRILWPGPKSRGMAAGFYGPGHNRDGWRPEFMARAIIARALRWRGSLSRNELSPFRLPQLPVLGPGDAGCSDPASSFSG